MPAAASSVRQLLELSDERDRWLARSLRMWRAGWQACWAVAWRAGYEAAHQELADAWHAVADPVVHGAPSLAEIEKQRWELRGESRTRQTFGRPHPDDFPGVAA